MSVCPSGVVLDVDGLVLAEVLHKLGAGRSKAGEPVNHSVGAELLVSVGQRVKKGETLMMMMVMMMRSGTSSWWFVVFPGVSWLRLHYESPAPTPDQIHRLEKALTLGTDNARTQQKQTLVKELLLPR